MDNFHSALLVFPFIFYILQFIIYIFRQLVPLYHP